MEDHWFDDEQVKWLVGNFIFQVSYMTVFWVICVVRNNGSMVDFGWPSGFTLLALYYAIFAPGYSVSKWMLCGMYIACGLRFMVGWNMRKHWTREDHRWNLWRERWRNGKGVFGFSSVPVNFFFFYHCQSLANGLVFVAPIHAVGFSPKTEVSPLEILALFLWLFSLVMETVADTQLSNWQRKNRGIKNAVCDVGLWKYSRHPNYFCEFLIWVSYLIFALPSAIGSPLLLVVLALGPPVAYYFLVHFTGIWMAEQGSLLRRGDAYRDYQMRTSAFFPWFPKKVRTQ